MATLVGGAPVNIAFRYFLGINTTDGGETFTVNPHKDLFTYMRGRFPTKNGLVNFSVDKNGKCDLF